MARYFFSPREYEIICSSSPDQKQAAFFDLWTLKEAYLKATGKGIRGLEQVKFSMSSGEAPISIINRENASAAEQWTMLRIIPSPGYTAGLAVEGKEMNLQFYFLK